VVKPLEYLRRLTGPVEDTRRVVCLRPPTSKPDDRGFYREGQWRGIRRGEGGMKWNTHDVWGDDIVVPEAWGQEGVDWHATRRDVCVDVEAAPGAGPPEPWWREYFGGLRGQTRKLAQPGGGLLHYDMGAGTGGSVHRSRGDTEYFGSRRSPAFLRIYLKYLRPGVHQEVKQKHLDAWKKAGWTEGAVYRVEAVMSPPTELGLGVAPHELFADAAARIRLLDHPPEKRACDVPTAERWKRLADPLKLERPKDTAPDEAAARLRRAMARLVEEHGKEAVRLALLMNREGRESVSEGRASAQAIERLTDREN
jgi:hypothetical protein